MKKKLKKYEIIDDLSLSSNIAIEVNVTFNNDEKRWCFFITHEALKIVGEIIPGTNIKYFVGAEHCIIVQKIGTKEISIILKQMDSDDELYECTEKF